MFRLATPQNTRRARPQVGHITPVTLPSKGMNARDTFQAMGPQYAISLINVVVESYGVRTRRGYSDWAIQFAGAPVPVWTVMSYHPPSDELPSAPTPAGRLFASKDGMLYDVTEGGLGPWLPEAGVTGGSDFWTGINFNNVGGSFLVVTNDAGGYAYYDGTSWTTPVMGAGVGQIGNVDPLTFAFVVEFKKRLWFVERNSTRAWYLPVSQITGDATMFDFGEQFRRGGYLVALANWTIDGGAGVDDYLVAVSSQGDVVLYQGSDPDNASTFGLRGVWDVGALPAGRRSVSNTGGDVLILSQFGVTPLSALLSSPTVGAIDERRLSYQIGPLIARLMRDYSSHPGWSVCFLPTEELVVITIPFQALDYGGSMFALKVPMGAWQVFRDAPYVSFCTVDATIFAGTHTTSKVVRAFDGEFDAVSLAGTGGRPIQCQVTPAYQHMGMPGQQKVWKLVRPTFVTSKPPTLTLQIMTDYGPPRPVLVPTLPLFDDSYWDNSFWNTGHWSGTYAPIAEWFGCRGVGYVGTVQMEYTTGGGTLLTSIDYWTEEGGVM